MVVFQEIDYTKEAFNAEKFAENFKNMDYVKVPSIYWEYTTPQVLSKQKLVNRFSSNIGQKIKLKFIFVFFAGSNNGVRPRNQDKQDTTDR